MKASQFCKRPQAPIRAKLCDDRQAVVRPNDVWAMDFVHDYLATGQKLPRGLDDCRRLHQPAAEEARNANVGWSKDGEGLIRGRTLRKCGRVCAAEVIVPKRLRAPCFISMNGQRKINEYALDRK